MKPVYGPYDTERETWTAPLPREVDQIHAAHPTSRDIGHLVDSAVQRHLEAACAAAGVELGAFDRRILAWIAQFEPSNAQVVIGLIGRAHRAGGGLAADVHLRQQIARVRALTCRDTDLYDRDDTDTITVAELRAALNDGPDRA